MIKLITRYFLLSLPLIACSSAPPARAGSGPVWKVEHYRVPCTGEGVQWCYLIDKGSGETEYFYDEIEGFTYEWGYRYELAVEREPVKQPMADAGAYRYRLVRQVSRQAAPPEARFELPLQSLGATLVEARGDTCWLLGEVPIRDNGETDCEALASVDSATFRHGENGSIVWQR